MEVSKIGDLAGFGEAISKLIETVAKGVGVLYEPWHKVRLAKADAKTIGIISATIANNTELFDLPTSYDDGTIKIEPKQTELAMEEPTSKALQQPSEGSTATQSLTTEELNEYKELLVRSVERTLYQEVSKELNIEAVIERAAELLKDETVVSSKPVDTSWANALFDSAGYINDPELQKVWGDVLAAEVKEPGQTSMRTLDVLKKISSDEAKLFDKIADYILNAEDLNNHVIDYFVFTDDAVMGQMGVTFPELLKLIGAGLLMYNGGTVSVGYKLNPHENREIYVGDAVAFELKNDSDKVIDAMKPAVLLTEAGREVYMILYKNKVDTNKMSYYQVCKEYMLRDETKELWDALDG